MRVTVLGGTVFVGRAVVEQLVADGHRVQVVHRGRHEPDDSPALSEAEHLHVDRAALTEARDALADFAPDAVVDASALTAADAAIALAALPDVTHRVVLSSLDVYRAYDGLHAGTVTDPVPLDEDAPTRTRRYPYRGRIEGMDDYEKLDVEEAYLDADGVALRLGFVIGPHDRQRREEPVLRRLRAGRRRLPVGAASFVGSRVLAADVGRAVAAVLGTGLTGRVLNVCETSSPSSALWARWIARAAGHELELVRVPTRHLPEDLALFGSPAQDLLATNQRARSLLGWTPTEPEEATETSVAWHLANPPQPPDTDFAADERALAEAAPAPDAAD